jgi:transposase-like protein
VFTRRFGIPVEAGWVGFADAIPLPVSAAHRDDLGEWRPQLFFVDEAYVKVDSRWTYLYRAIDQFGQVIDDLVSGRRDSLPRERSLPRALTASLLRLRSPPTRHRSTTASLATSWHCCVDRSPAERGLRVAGNRCQMWSGRVRRTRRERRSCRGRAVVSS